MENYVYGKQPVNELLRANAKVLKLFTTDATSSLALQLKQAGVPIVTLTKVEMDRRFFNGAHQGIIAQIPPFTYKDENWLLQQAVGKESLLVVLDGIEDPQNLGAIARSALAAGATALLIRKDRQALVTPAAIKASAGLLARMDVVLFTNTVQVIKQLKQKGYWVVGAVGQARDSYMTTDVNAPLVVIIGNEHAGISRLVQEQLDFPVSIAMANGVDSLNASNAAAVILMDIFNRRLFLSGKKKAV